MEIANVDPEKAKMNVLVQEFIPAKLSGIFFTQHPVIGREYASCQFGYMQGEGLVSGEECGIVATINRSTGLFKLQGDSSSVPRYANPNVDLDSCKIIPKAFEIEKTFNHPQDIEFTVGENGVTYILQSRDITGLK